MYMLLLWLGHSLSTAQKRGKSQGKAWDEP
jgi:hypothetical protein